MSRARLALPLALSFAIPCPLAAAPQGGVEVQEFEPPDGQAGDGFGYRVERAGKVAVVASTYDDDLGLDSGSVYVYLSDPLLGWQLAQKRHASDGAAGDSFGYSVAVDGERVLVGAPGHDGATSDCGALYVFARNQGGVGNWGEVARFAPQGLAPGAGFGYSLAVRGEHLLVGAPHHARGVAGRAYLYRRDAASASGWTLELDFTSADPATAFEFGQDVALGDGLLAVSGARTSIQPYSDTYAVHLYERDARGAGGWNEVRRLESPSGTRDIFGYEIALDGDLLVAVAPAEIDFASLQVGALYLYRRALGGASNWGLERRLVDPQVDGFFTPDEVDVEGDWIAAGSFSSSAEDVLSAGAVSVFGRNAGGKDAWAAVARLTDEEPTAGAYFGLDLALEEDELLVGAPGQYSGAASGEVYVLDLARVPRATWRNDAAGRNPDVHRAETRPWLGTNYVAEVDLGGTGHTTAVLVLYAHAAELALPGGRVRLGSTPLGRAVASGPLARFQFALPADSSLSGLALSTQARLVGGGRPYALSNAQDLVLGFP